MEERNRILLQANSELQSQIEEREDECNDLAKKYSNLVQKVVDEEIISRLF